MKRILTAILAVCTCIAFTSCGKDTNNKRKEKDKDEDKTSVISEEPTEGTTRLSRSERKKLEAQAKTEPPAEAPTEPPTQAPTKAVGSLTVTKGLFDGIVLGSDEGSVIGSASAKFISTGITTTDDGVRCYFSIDSLYVLDCDKSACMYLDFDSEGTLSEYGISIGYDMKESAYTGYKSDEMTEEFDKLAETLSKYGTPSIREAAHCAWTNTEIGNITLFGDNLYNGGATDSSITISVKKPEGASAETSADSIIPGIGRETTLGDIIKLYGEDYEYKEEYVYKATTQYSYKVDENIFGVDLPTYVFFEFDEDGKMFCYGYHFGADLETSTFPCSEKELSNNYKKVYKAVSALYGEGEKQSNFTDSNVFSEYSWKNSLGDIWFVYGVNMWSSKPPVSYEKGINEIILSCSVV